MHCSLVTHHLLVVLHTLALLHKAAEQGVAVERLAGEACKPRFNKGNEPGGTVRLWREGLPCRTCSSACQNCTEEPAQARRMLHSKWSAWIQGFTCSTQSCHRLADSSHPVGGALVAGATCTDTVGVARPACLDQRWVRPEQHST